jgi:hypothetical protein
MQSDHSQDVDVWRLIFTASIPYLQTLAQHHALIQFLVHCFAFRTSNQLPEITQDLILSIVNLFNAAWTMPHPIGKLCKRS